MTDNELRIAVAEQLGWTPDKDGWWSGPKGESTRNGTPPAYTTSLDACHEGWEKDAPWQYWLVHLLDIVRSGHVQNKDDLFVAICNATPSQRCRAFLKGSAARKGK